MNTFADAARNKPVYTQTTNGMTALETTSRYNVDLFGSIGASRGKDITPLFAQALAENPEYAIRIALWGRDVRGGAGERELFKSILRHLENNNPRVLLDTNLLSKVPDLGRWDDLLVFTDVEIKSKAYGLIARALGENNGLAAKWMPRKGPIAIELRNFLGLTPKAYRKLLVRLTKVVETQMCNREFSAINFSHVPSLAMSRYTKAFNKNAPEQFTAYKNALKKGDPSVKVNASAVYPYDIIKNLKTSRDSSLVDSQWDALPNYIGDANVLPIVDVSGSMMTPAGRNGNVTCLDVSISLGLYCASKNQGKFKDVWMTFSGSPELVTLRGSVSSRYSSMASNNNWGMNTNIEAALKLVLDTAIEGNVPQTEMPSALLIMSDMQFDQCVTTGSRSPDRWGSVRTSRNPTAIEMVRQMYRSAGYNPPAVIFWNLNDHGNMPVRYDETGAALVSGFSPAIMKSVLSADLSNMTPEGIMRKTIMQEKYDFR